MVFEFTYEFEPVTVLCVSVKKTLAVAVGIGFLRVGIEKRTLYLCSIAYSFSVVLM